ncbi:MAG: 3-dehydroquinate synthase [Cellulosilyticaceae bacterium]
MKMLMRILDKSIKKPYEIIITDDFVTLENKIKETLVPSSLLIVTDDHVEKLYLKEVTDRLDDIAPVYTHVIKAGEISKTLDTVTRIYETLIGNNLDRSTMIVALGGGVVGDIAGFVAASYMRGIPFIQIPTTVVAQNDSSIGGKVGVDYFAHKNMIGAFCDPKLVYINVSTLKTLCDREFVGGLAEVVKHALIKDETFYEYLNESREGILKKDTQALLEMTYRSCQIKAEVVEQDSHEMGIRKILNFGHTVGHAIETLSQFAIIHGECVGYGISISSYISYRRNLITQEELQGIISTCKQYGLLTPLKHHSIEEILEQMKYDKKKSHHKISFILLDKIGEALIVCDVTDDEISQAVLFTEKTCH